MLIVAGTTKLGRNKKSERNIEEDFEMDGRDNFGPCDNWPLWLRNRICGEEGLERTFSDRQSAG